jgi:restriction system protein
MTGMFSAEAVREANREGAPPIELVDGEKLVAMFEAVKLGVKPRVVYETESRSRNGSFGSTTSYRLCLF